MSQLKIRLLGSPQLILGGQAVTTMRSDKVRALLAYLFVEQNQPHRREKLAGLLWPDYPEISARGSLRRALTDLRRSIGDSQTSTPYLEISRQTIQFNRASDAWVDVAAFIKLVQTTQNQKITCAGEDAIDLYQGEFMEGFSLPDSPVFEDWLRINREQLHRLALETLDSLVEAYESLGDYERALLLARRRLGMESWNENTHRQIMRLLALTGQREAALIQFETCCRTLATELGVKPSIETLGLYEHLLNGDWQPRARAETEIAVQIPRAIGECPYRGLSAFAEQDAPVFFGRESFTERLIGSIRSWTKAAVIIGSSGSGKSSAVYAGLLPYLREKNDWIIVHFRPGMQPFHAMAAAMIPLLDPMLSETDQMIESQKLAFALAEGEISLHLIINRILEKSPTAKWLLLFIDQFEEMYTLCPEPQSSIHFVDTLLQAITNNRGLRDTPLTLLLALRVDFLGQALAHRPFADTLQSAAMMLGPMTRDELREAIEKPAQVQGAAFERGLVERILDDVGTEPGSLPLLEFALTQLWEQVDSGWLTHKGYDRIGQVDGALARYAEQVYVNLSETEQVQARYIFGQLVRPGVGTEDTRRLASKAEIGESNWPLVQHLADKRLVVTGADASGRETVELIHEALIGIWGRLKDWIESDRSFRTWQDRIRAAMSQWAASNRDEDALLRGAPLTEAERWLSERGNDLSQLEIVYIQSSQDLRQYMHAERDRLRQRIILGLGVGLVVTLILASFAGWQWRSAQQARMNAVKERDLTRISLSRSLATQAQQLVHEDLDLALLLSVEAVNIDASTEAHSSLLATLSEKPQLTYFLHGHEDEVVATALSSNGRYLATGSADGTVILWELLDIESTATPVKITSMHDHAGAITSLAFSPDSRLLASASSNDMINLWSVPSGNRAALPLTGHTGYLWSVVFSPDGRFLISSGADGQILLWDLGSGVNASSQPDKHPLASDLGTVSSLAVSPDGNLLAAGLNDGSVILWDLEILTVIGEPLVGHDRLLRALSFSPDSQMLASGGDDLAIIIWDSDRASPTFGQQIGAPLTGHNDWVTSLVFHPDGQSLISAGKDGRILMRDLSRLNTSGQSPTSQILSEQSIPVWDLAISPDGHWLVSGGGAQNAILWDLTKIHPLAQGLLPEAMESYRPILTSLTFKPTVLDLAFSPDGKLLAAAYFDGSIILWDRASGQPLKLLSAHMPPTGEVDTWYWADIYTAYGLAFSPDGRFLASATEHHIYLWDAHPDSETFGQQVAPPLEGHTKTVNTIDFSPDGQILASGGDDLSIILWDMNQKSTAFGESLGQFVLEPESAIMELYFDETGTKLVSVGISNIHILEMAEMLTEGNRSIGLPISTRYYDPAFRLISTNPTASIMAVPEENVITFWDIDQGSQTFSKKLPVSLDSPGGRIYATDFSPDGRLLASGDNSEQLQLWSMVDHQPIGPPLLGHKNDVLNLRFSPDGMSLASGDYGGVVILWDLELGDWIAQACRRANRNLTQQEWQRYFGDEPYRAICADDN